MYKTDKSFITEHINLEQKKHTQGQLQETIRP